MSSPGAARAPRTVKCVVWDLDRTLLDGTWLEHDEAEPPGAHPAMLAAAVELQRRGVLNAVASRNPAQVWTTVSDLLAPVTFVAVELGWDRKSVSLGRIAERLGFGTDALAFVDDDPYQRAEVGFALPDVLVLSPDQVPQAMDWPELSPAVVTAEAARRAGLYRAGQQRDLAARESGRPLQEFLAGIGTRVLIRSAGPDDVSRLHELSVRTHRFNSTGRVIEPGVWSGLLADGRHRVQVVELSDRFGDDGLVGAVLVDPAPGELGQGSAWTADLLMMSCRAIGRGVIEGLLDRLTADASAAGAGEVAVPCLLTERNVPLRLAMLAAGFRALSTGPEAAPVVFTRSVAPTAAAPPQEAERPGELGELRALLARITGRADLADLPAAAPLFGGAVGLDSLRGTLLLAEVRLRFGVDVADLDVNLDSLASLGALADFVRSHRVPGGVAAG